MIVPSIDIMNGRAVQLKQGKELVLTDPRDPIELARQFNRYGEVAVIDLDAALGKGNNRQLIAEICRVADARVGGGIRDIDTAREILKLGARRLIFGTAAVPELLSQLPAQKVMVALDHKDGQVLDKGWTRETGESLVDRAQRLSSYCGGYLVTFVETEGSMTGMDLNAIKSLNEQLKKPLTVAGGIAKSTEIVEIAKLGIDVQVGMALYTGAIDIAESVIDSVAFLADGLVPTIVQDLNGQVLMLAYSNKDSLRRALDEGKGIYFSRSRKEIWEKGKTSGNTQELISCRVDCDRDALLFTVKQTNAACHTQSYSCFGGATSDRKFSLPQLFEILKTRKATMPEKSYSATLFKDRATLFAKILEEANEVVSYTSHDNLRWEIADVIYFLSVLAVDEGIEWNDIQSELGGRR
jgi:phosphoribosyl-ATP pyrophosphohydrolase/phosphoribosyl-AMP cyclohydrolase